MVILYLSLLGSLLTVYAAVFTGTTLDIAFLNATLRANRQFVGYPLKLEIGLRFSRPLFDSETIIIEFPRFTTSVLYSRSLRQTAYDTTALLDSTIPGESKGFGFVSVTPSNEFEASWVCV